MKKSKEQKKFEDDFLKVIDKMVKMFGKLKKDATELLDNAKNYLGIKRG